MKLEIQHGLTPMFAQRRFFVHPPEPPEEILGQDPRQAVYLGKTRIFHNPYCWNHLDLCNPHIAVVGITGSGKSVLCKTLITRANLTWGTSTLILDWSGEYVGWVEQTGGRVVRLGKNDFLNLLDLGQMTPARRVRQIIQSLQLLTDLREYPDQIRWTHYALERAYVQKGFRLYEHCQKKPPTLKDAEKILHRRAKECRIEPIEKREIESAAYRLSQLTSRGNDYFNRPSTVALDDLFGKGLVCVDLSGLPSENMRSLGGLVLLQFAREKMRIQGVSSEKGLRQFILLDEAWKICQDQNGQETDPIAIVREGRKYQFGLIVASQNPTDVSPKIFSNVGTLFTFRIKYQEYVEYLQNTLRFSDRVKRLIQNQSVGECVVSQALGMATPYPETFALQRIDAQERVQEYVLCEEYGGRTMAESIRFEKNELFQELARMGVKQDTRANLAVSMEKNKGHYPVTSFIMDLESAGVGREALVHFLKKTGMADYMVAKIFDRVESKKTSNAKTVKLRWDDETP